MKKLIKKCMLLLLIAIAFILIGNFITENRDGSYSYKMSKEMYESATNIDMVVIGSSHVVYSFIPQTADDILPYNTFNAATVGQGINSTYYWLREISDYNDVKVVLLDTYYGIPTQADNDSQVYTVSDIMRSNKYRYELLQSNGGLPTVFNGFVKVRRNITNINIWANVKSRFTPTYDYSSVTYPTEYYVGKGFVYFTGSCKQNPGDDFYSSAYNYDFTGDFPVSDLYYEYLQKIIALCKEKDIRLILIDQPVLHKTLENIKGYDNYVDFISNIAEENNLEYWNYNLYKQDLSLNPTFYVDNHHLNGKGADIYTRAICDTMLQIDQAEASQEDLFNKRFE